MNFFLLTLVTGILYVRPTDFVPGLEQVPLYYICMVACLVVSWGAVMAQLSPDALARNPITVLVLGILFSSMLSNLALGDIDRTFNFATEFFKIVLYYLLVAGVVDTPARLRWFLAISVGFDLIPTILALLQYHEVIHIPAFTILEEHAGTDPLTGERRFIKRLGASGNFGDPNDVCQLLAVAIIFCTAGLLDQRRGLLRLGWLAPMGLFGEALRLTQSRGGFLSLLIGLVVLFWSRFGRKRSIMLMVVFLPVMFLLFGGRQTALSTSEGTSQGRIQIWAEGFALFLGAPILGIGTNRYGEFVGHVGHNSFVHCFTELGYLGGVMYLGAFWHGLQMLFRLGRPPVQLRDPELVRLRPFILAALVTYTAGELGLTHCYTVPTYGMLGLATAFLRQADVRPPLPGSTLNGRFLVLTLRRGVLFVAVWFVVIRFLVRWNIR